MEDGWSLGPGSTNVRWHEDNDMISAEYISNAVERLQRAGYNFNDDYIAYLRKHNKTIKNWKKKIEG